MFSRCAAAMASSRWCLRPDCRDGPEASRADGVFALYYSTRASFLDHKHRIFCEASNQRVKGGFNSEH
jgi:hypothetical protein